MFSKTEMIVRGKHNFANKMAKFVLESVENSNAPGLTKKTILNFSPFMWSINQEKNAKAERLPRLKAITN